ncbi:hypothetical protein HCN44_010747 [Aphidius gifuensis]|uniref:Beta-ketoacyl synthase-like N-terminal domain-containing protein n=1 Tax=Aphidius gifuensis TaxID=684658 RepID=A0A834XSD8_APHGI|nr:fatty acid synthase-like [Aphidius gifuensis]KAF7991946.1 hypothetical protein HCN44_010747 [Aphidius gifuensis]
MAIHHETTIIKSIDPGDEIVISGISGRFPECNNMEELKNNLFSKVDMVTDDCHRWKNDINGVPMRSGKIKDIDKFYASYFGLNANQANATDPMCRILLECAYETTVDAGEKPNKISGRTEEAVDYQSTNIENRLMDTEFMKLIHGIYADDIPSHLDRGEWNDQQLINHTRDRLSRTIAAKKWNTKIFDKLSRKLCPMLNYFVVFSLIICSHPIAWSTNYSMANSIIERIG